MALISFTFEIKGRSFQAEKLSAFAQLHVSRRIAPLMPPLLPVYLQVINLIGVAAEAEQSADLSGDDAKAEAVQAFLHDNISLIEKLLQPLADAFGSLKDEDAEKVVNLCLGSVKVQTSPGVWMPMWIGGRANPDELNDMGEWLPIVIRVIQENLGPFIAGLLTSRKSAVKTPSAA
jgi:hypothetical protein